jgi:IS4 transposase
VFQDLVRKITSQIGVSSTLQHLGNIHLIDSSTISMAINHYRWAEFRKTKAGVKLHLRLVYVGGTVYPDKAVLTPAKSADKKQLEHLIVTDPDALNVYDRGYVDYRAFDYYCANGIRFVTRLKANAEIQVIEEKTVSAGSTIRREAIVRLGNPQNYQMEHELRLIESVDTEGNLIVILTNDFQMTPEELSDVYRCRWQIELFFKWMKQHLKLKTCYGRSRNAVYSQIRIALITFCLLVLLKIKSAHRGRLLKVLKFLRLYWDSDFTAFIQALHRVPTRTSRGRRRWDSERIFRETLQQYENREVSHLDDLAYDPIV